MSNKFPLSHQVMEFHLAMGQPVHHRPQIPAEERIRLRAKLIAEEFSEVMSALFDLDTSDLPPPFPSRANTLREILKEAIDKAPVKVDMVDLADGLADLDYVVEGTRLEFGIYGKAIADEVHASNMAKVGGPVREDGKMLKPLGWKPPDIAGVLKELGWQPEKAALPPEVCSSCGGDGLSRSTPHACRACNGKGVSQ